MSPPRDRHGPPPADGVSRREDDRLCFETEMERLGGVRPLAKGPARLVNPPPVRAPNRVGGAAGRVEKNHSALVGSTPALVAWERAGDAFAFAAAGIDRRSLRQLEDGTRRPEASLDLHGRKSGEAEARLEAFVSASLAVGRRIVHVVHGRGKGSGEAGPVLRRLVLERLTTPPLCGVVLAVVSAPPALGGPGAALIWLRRAG